MDILSSAFCHESPCGAEGLSDPCSDPQDLLEGRVYPGPWEPSAISLQLPVPTVSCRGVVLGKQGQCVPPLAQVLLKKEAEALQGCTPRLLGWGAPALSTH